MAGSIILTFAFVFSLFSMITYYLTFRGAKNTLNYARLSYHASAMLVIIASALLWFYILTHNYSYQYVYSYSNDELPLGFLIATFWAGQEGSFMLWLLLTIIIGVMLQSYTSKRGELEYRVMTVYSLAVTFLLAMVSPLMKNPFAMIYTHPVFIDMKNISPAFLSQPFMQNFFFSDPGTNQAFVRVSEELFAAINSAGMNFSQLIIQGKGLNPLLQNFWMQIHPPILFAGFAMATVPFAFAIAALMKNDYKDWVRQSFPWILSASAVLGLGIMLGGYWAYGILGWGGYWAWDPVENSSLVPWLVSVAAIHTMLVQRRSQSKYGSSGKFIKTNLILSILFYVLVIYSTFLTRSGILGDASVHSFVDPGTIVYLFLVVFICTFILLGAGMIAYRWKYLNSLSMEEESLLSRELSLFTAAVTLGASAFIVLVGTSAPIFGHSVDTVFYDEMHIPLAIIIGLLNGLSLLLKWKHTEGKDLLEKSKFSVIATVIATLLVVFIGGVYDLMMILLAISAFFTLFVNAEIAWKIFNGNRKMLGAYVAHIGIAFFILGVIGSAAYSQEKEISLAKNETTELFGYKLQFTSIQPIENNKKYAFNISMKKGEKEYVVSPIMYISSFNNSLMREPDILPGFIKDFYVSPISYEDGTGGNHDDHSHGEVLVIKPGEQSFIRGINVIYKDFIKPDMAAMTSGGDITMGIKVEIKADGKTFEKDLLVKTSQNGLNNIPVDLTEKNLRLALVNIDPATKNASIEVSALDGSDGHGDESTGKETLTVTASIKPFVNFVWFGVIVMVAGFFIAASRRLTETLSS